MKDNLFKKFLSFSYGSWIGLFIGLLGTIITTRILDPIQFGKASMFTLALNIFMIFNMLGTDQSFVRFFYEEDEDKRGALLYQCIIPPIIVTSILGAAILIFSRALSIFLFDEYRLLVIVLLVFGIAIQTFYRYAILVIRMQQKGNLYSIIEIANRVLSLVTLLVLYFLVGADYIIIIYSTLVNLVILSIFGIVKERKYWNISNLSIKELVHTKRDILRFGSPFMVTLLITWLFQSFDKIAIRQWSSFNELGLYAAAFKIVGLVMVLQTSFSIFWTSVALEKYHTNPGDKGFFSDMTQFISIGMFLVAILSILGKDIIIYLLGSEFKHAANIMPFLVFMPLMYTISEATVIGINFLKKPKWHILIAGISCIINILGNWLLVPSFGAIGAAISTAFSYIVFFTLRTLISNRLYKVNHRLKKIYLMLVFLIIYSFYSIYTTSFIMNFFFGIVMIFILFIVYKNDIKKIKKYIQLKNYLK